MNIVTKKFYRKIDRGSKCVEASKKRYDRMKAGHPTGYIEAFANTYIDIKKEINDWIAKGVDSSSYGLDINLKFQDFWKN